jgi:hypothetical protein
MTPATPMLAAIKSVAETAFWTRPPSRSTGKRIAGIKPARSWWTQKEKGAVHWISKPLRRPVRKHRSAWGAKRPALDGTTDAANLADTKGSDSTYPARWAAISQGARSYSAARRGAPTSLPACVNIESEGLAGRSRSRGGEPNERLIEVISPHGVVASAARLSTTLKAVNIKQRASYTALQWR